MGAPVGAPGERLDYQPAPVTAPAGAPGERLDYPPAPAAAPTAGYEQPWTDQQQQGGMMGEYLDYGERGEIEGGNEEQEHYHQYQEQQQQNQDNGNGFYHGNFHGQQPINMKQQQQSPQQQEYYNGVNIGPKYDHYGGHPGGDGGMYMLPTHDVDTGQAYPPASMASPREIAFSNITSPRENTNTNPDWRQQRPDNTAADIDAYKVLLRPACEIHNRYIGHSYSYNVIDDQLW